jgi:predicted ATPase
MLSGLRLGNFKAFADTQRLPIRPLTLIFGANSSGKSSLIHGLLLARHAMETGELDVHRTAIGGESVDLGGFRQYVHRRDAARQLEWAGEIDVAQLQGRLAELLAPVHRAAVSLSIGIELGDQGEPLQDTIPGVMSYEIEADGVSLLRMSRRRDGHLQLDRLDHEHPVFRGVIRAIVETATTTDALTAADFEGVDDAIAALVPEVTVQVEKFLPSGLVRSEHPIRATDQLTLFPISRGRRKEDLAAAVRFFLPRTLDELIHGLNDAVAQELSRLRYLGPLRSYPPRHLAFSQHHDPNWFAGGGYAWDIVRRDESVRAAVNAWLGSEKLLKTCYELVVRDLLPDRVIAKELSPKIAKALHDVVRDLLRPAAATGDEHDSLDLRASELADELERATPEEMLPDIEEIISNLVDSDVAAEKWTRELALASIDQLRDLVLIDRRTNTPVSHRDIGIGISQVLPVLVSAYASAEKILAIEQPEIHLHPALQGELGDVFIESALGGRHNTFILETHSEHLILRIMRRMRDTVHGALPDGLPPVRPEDVAILYVQPRDSAAVVRLLELDEEGQLLDPWPGRFFEEGFRERFA